MSILTNGRIPIIPLPYEYKHMAVKRELVISAGVTVTVDNNTVTVKGLKREEIILSFI